MFFCCHAQVPTRGYSTVTGEETYPCILCIKIA
nr:MAG TPA: C2H2 type zinc-finger protein [Caudoviricetes sp.]